MWHQVGFLFFNWHNDARSNIHKFHCCIYSSPSQNVILNQPAQYEPSHSVPLNLNSKLDHKIFTEINYKPCNISPSALTEQHYHQMDFRKTLYMWLSCDLAKLREATFIFVINVRLRATNRFPPNGCSWNFVVEYF